MPGCGPESTSTAGVRIAETDLFYILNVKNTLKMATAEETTNTEIIQKYVHLPQKIWAETNRQLLHGWPEAHRIEPERFPTNCPPSGSSTLMFALQFL